MAGVEGNSGGKKGRSGRKGYGIENAKKHLLEQSYWIVNKKLEKIAKDLTEKEKIELAKQVVLKEMGSNIDFTTKGKSINYDDEQIKRVANEILGGRSKE